MVFIFEPIIFEFVFVWFFFEPNRFVFVFCSYFWTVKIRIRIWFYCWTEYVWIHIWFYFWTKSFRICICFLYFLYRIYSNLYLLFIIYLNIFQFVFCFIFWTKYILSVGKSEISHFDSHWSEEAFLSEMWQIFQSSFKS